MKNYPINLDLDEKKVLLVGGGKVALRKFKRLLKTGAFVRIVSPKLNADFRNTLEQKKINNKWQYFKRKFQQNDLIDIFFVIAASNDQNINKRIASLAKEKNILTNIVDNKDISDFILPSVVKRGDFMVSFSTNGKLPALSRELRIKFEKKFGKEYELYLEIIGKIRNEIINKITDDEKRKRIFRSLANKDLIENIEKNTLKVFSEIEKVINKEIEGESNEKENNYRNKAKSTCSNPNRNCSK